VLGTRPEYFSAVWVKNEWSRFLTQIKGGAKKALIPAYKDMDPYDLPEEFSYLQAQDMSKLGFMQDLIRGIKKLVVAEEKTTENKSVVMESVPASSGAQALVERAFLFLEDGEFARADELCEQALNQDPKNAKAYVGKLMAERKLRKQDELSKGTEVLTQNNYFQKALRFAEEGLKKELDRCNEMIMDNKNRLTYNEAMQMVRDSGVKGGVKAAVETLNQAIAKYESLLGWRDSAAQLDACRTKRTAYFDQMYQDAMKLMKTDSSKLTPDSMLYVMSEAIEELEYLVGYHYLDSKKLLEECIDKRRKLKAEIRKKQTRRVTIGSIAVLLIVAMITGTVAFTRMVRNKLDGKRYDTAVAAIQEGEYGKAVSALEKISNETYKSSLDNDLSKVYNEALKKYRAGNYDEAEPLFEGLGKYKESEIYLNYALAKKLIAQGNYAEAEEYFNILAELGKDTSELTYQKALAYMENGEYDKAIEAFSTILDYSGARDKIKDSKYQIALTYMENEEYDKAIEAFSAISGYKDAADKIEDAEKQKKYQEKYLEKYLEAMSYMETGEYVEAMRILNSLPNDYKDVKSKKNECEKLKEEAEEVAKEANKLKNYQEALSYMEKGEYDKAKGALLSLPNDYKDVKAKKNECDKIIEEAKNANIYKEAMSHMEQGEYDKAMGALITLPNNYNDIQAKKFECMKGMVHNEDKHKWYQYFAGMISSGGWRVAGLKADGTVVKTDKYLDVSSFTDIVAISVGSWHVAGLKADGTVVVTGDSEQNVFLWKNIVAISAGDYYTVGVKADGTVTATGDNEYGQCNVHSWDNIAAISAGSKHTVGLKADGTVVATGANDYGQCDVSNWTDIVAISAGENHTVGVKADGTVVAKGSYRYNSGSWNSNSWTDIVAIFSGANHAVGLRADGTVVATGANDYGQCDVSGWTDIVAISAGDYNTVGLKADGTVVATGANNSGQCDVTDWNLGI